MQTIGAPKPGKAKDLFDLMYPNNTASCYVCHVGNPGALTPYGSMYVQNAGTKLGTMSALHAIEGLDADNDGINNGLEIRTGTDPNIATSLTGVLGVNNIDGDILVSGANVSVVSVTPVQDLYTAFGVNLPQGQQLLGNAQFSYTQNTIAPVTVAFTKASGYGTVKVYEQTAVGASKEIPSSVTVLGNITFTATSTNPTIAVESTIDLMESNASGGCLMGTSLPLGLMLLLLVATLFKRKK